jgi:Mo-dependent nitrogenase C-terminus
MHHSSLNKPEEQQMNILDYTTENMALTSWTWISPAEVLENASSLSATSLIKAPTKPTVDLLYPLRQWLTHIPVRNRQVAHLICKLIPTQCPFERDLKFFGRTLLHIPPLCKLNPLYEEVVALKFRALCYLADECGEDISCYC